MRIVPATEIGARALQDLLAPVRCHGGACHCQRFLVPPAMWALFGDGDRARLLEEEFAASAAGPGLVALVNDRPAGWCRVGPRSELRGLAASHTIWPGRDEDPSDPGVWAVSCLFVAVPFRRLGLTRPLVAAAAQRARDYGAKAVEGYPMIAPEGKFVSWGEMHVGSVDTFLRAEFHRVHQPSKRRVVMRREF